MKTLTLIRFRPNSPEKDSGECSQGFDNGPRLALFGSKLNSDMLDQHFLRRVEGIRGWIYRFLPGHLAQLVEAFFLRNHYDAIISWGEQYGLPLALLFKLTRTRTPHIGIFSWVSRPKKARLLAFAGSSLDSIILMSSMQREFVVEHCDFAESKIALLRWPVDQTFWRPIERQQDMICSVGREMRDYSTLLSALRGLDVRCHIAANAVSDKKDRWIEALARNGSDPLRITVGEKSFVELRELYARSRFVVVPLYPTDTDNGTTTILEAMAMGRAVICSRVEGQRDVVQESVTGLTVPPNDVEALRDAIQYLWDHPEEARAMGVRGRKVVESCHTLDAWVADVRRIVEEVIESKRSQANKKSRATELMH